MPGRTVHPRGRESSDREQLSRRSPQANHESSRMWEVSFEMLATVRDDGYFQQVNPRWQEILGWTPEELLRSPLADFIHPDDRQRSAAEAAKLKLGGADTVSFENRYRCRDGSYRWLIWNAMASAEDDLIYAAGHDVTDRKRQDEKLKAAGEQLQELSEELEARVNRRTIALANANKELEAFSYSVSHDLRAPLRAVDGYSQALLEDFAADLPEAAVDDLNRVRAASQRMAAMIDEMLALSRVTTRDLQRSPVDLTAVADEIIADLRREGDGRSVDTKIQRGLRTSGDPVLLQQVIRNLLENAWKFTDGTEGAEVSFTTLAEPAEADEYQHFVVRDNGAGFDMRYADKLFRPFERLHRQDEFAGTGVGLTTVARILNRHGGRIRAEGELGKGANIYFDLPLKAPVEDA